MPETRRINLQFPLAGLAQDKAFRDTPPFATADCLNVRPENQFNHRRMGGSRPGVCKAFDQSLGDEIRFLSNITYVNNDDTRTFFQDNFDALLGLSPSSWELPSWLGIAISTSNGFAVGRGDTVNEAGALLKDIPVGTDYTDYTVEMLIPPYRDISTSAIYRVLLRMDNTTPDITDDGIIVKLTLTGFTPNASSNYSLNVSKVVAGVTTSLHQSAGLIGLTSSGQSWGWLKCHVDGDYLDVDWGATSVVSALALPAAAGHRVAFSLQRSSLTGGYNVPPRVETFRVRYAGTPDSLRTVAMAVAGGDVWRETELGVMEQSASTVTLASDRRINGAEYLQKMYLADSAMKVTTRSGSIDQLQFGATNIAIAANVVTLTLYATTGLMVGQYCTVFSKTTVGANTIGSGTFKITAVTATTITYDLVADNLASQATTGNATVKGVAATMTGWFGTDVVIGEDVLEYAYFASDGSQLAGGVTQIVAVVGGTTAIIRDPFEEPLGAATTKFTVWRGAKIYDPLLDTLALWTTESKVPEVFNIVAVQATDGEITFTTSPAHKFTVGQRVSVSISPTTGLPATSALLSNSNVNGVFTITETDPLESAPTTFKAIKPMGDNTLNDIAARGTVQGFKVKYTAANKFKLKTVTAHGFTNDDYITIVGAISSAIDGTWKITAIIGTKEIEVTTSGLALTVSAVYVPWSGEAYTAKGTCQLADYQGKGYVPAGCSGIISWRGRMGLFRGNTLFLSRIDAPLDFDYGAADTDESRAVALPLTDSGVIGKEIIAACPVDGNSLILACKNELWYLQGDPAAQGRLRNLSRTIGCVSSQAWCLTPDGTFVFLANGGLYAAAAQGGLPAPVTARPLPEQLRYIDDSFEVSMVYDTRDKGIHIFLTKKDVAFYTHWFFDWQDKGFWPFNFTTNPNCDPFSVCDYAGRDSSDNAVLLGCRDGYIRRFKDFQGTDDGQPFTSYIAFGPLRFSGNQRDQGTIIDLVCNPALDEDRLNRVNVALKVGYNHQEALVATSRFNQNFSLNGALTTSEPTGRDSVNPRLTGGSLVIVVSGMTDEVYPYYQTYPWGLEAISASLQNAGLARRL